MSQAKSTFDPIVDRCAPVPLRPHPSLSPAAVLVLQMALASRSTPTFDPTLFRSLDLPSSAEDRSLEELWTAGLLEHGEVDWTLNLTAAGWATVDELWPSGQMPGAEPALVLGAFDGQHDLPARVALPIAEITKLLRGEPRFLREAAYQSLRYRAWALEIPPTGRRDDRLLVRIDEGDGFVQESRGSSDGHVDIRVDEGTWLSIDRFGRCRECRTTMEEVLFLIAQGAG